MTDFVCIGDATQDNFFFINDASVHCNLKRDECVLELKYGQKIPAEKIGLTLGGNAANVATGLSKLALGTKLVTTFGDDERGAWIKRELMRTNVNLDDCETSALRTSNLSAIVVFKTERTILTYHTEGEDLTAKIPESIWVYVSSAPYKKNNSSAKIAFNPGTNDFKKGKEYLLEMLAGTDVLILNREEARIILDEEMGQEKEMLFKLCKLGPKIVAMTDGPKGAYVSDGQKTIFSKPANFKLLEPTGAGDAFSSGFLAGLWHNNMEIVVAMKWGLVNSGSVITKIGAQDGLLTAREINKYLEKHEQSTILV